MVLSKTTEDIRTKICELCEQTGIPIQDRSKVGAFGCLGTGAKVMAAGRSDVMIRFLLTTSDLDMDGERVMPDGMDVDTYLMKVRSWFVDHEYDALKCIGKIRSMRRAGNGWEADVVMLNRATNPYTQAVIAWAEEGEAPCSVGYTEVDAGTPTRDELKAFPGMDRIVRRSVALEGSSTALPCNASCGGSLVYDENVGKGVENLRRILVKSKIPDGIMRAMLPEPKKRRRVMVCG